MLVIGAASLSLPSRLLAALVYFVGASLAVFTLHRSWFGKASWIVALMVDLAVHGYVIERTGGASGPFLLLFALPIVVWGFQRAIQGGVSAAALSVLIGVGLGWISPGQGDGFAQSWVFRTFAFLLLGVFSGFLGRRLARERAEFQRARNELEQVQLDALSIVSCLSSGLLCLDDQLRIRLWNQSAEAILGRHGALENGESLDTLARLPYLQPFVQVVDPLLREQTHSNFQCSLTGGNNSGGDIRPLEGTVSPIIDSRGLYRGHVILFADISDRIAREAEEKSRERLAWIGQMSAGLAHEIRNSLKPITGSVELLLSEDVSPEQATLMDIILRESENLEVFLTEFLDFARDKTLQVRPQNLERVVKEEFQALAALSGGRVRIVEPSGSDSLSTIMADRSALAQILRNLGVNALEADETNRIELGWNVERQEAVLFVRDFGPGVPEDILNRVCDPFFTTKARGTGLGLAITRELVERQGGRLLLESRPDEGTTAWVRLPLGPPEVHSASDADPAEPVYRLKGTG